jgi:hypothetical protein
MRIRFRLKYLLFAFCFVIVAGVGRAQLNHYIYLQTDNQQPFYIKYNNRIYSSTASGYVILAKLKDGMVSFQLGFPKNDRPEQRFECTIANNDKGYVVKNFNEKGWGLFDLQTAEVIYPVTNTVTKPEVQPNNNTTPAANDPFANMLSKVTQDSTVKNVSIYKEEKAVVADTPNTTAPPVIVNEPVIVKKDTVQVVHEPSPPVAPDTQAIWIAPAKSAIKKVKSFESAAGRDVVYEVSNESGGIDIIRLFIASDNTSTPQKDSVAVFQRDSVVVSQKDSTVVPQKTVEQVEAPPVKDTITIQKPEIKQPPAPAIKPEQQVPVTDKPAENKTEPKNVPNSNCKAEASEEDFVKLRRKMASQSKDQSMVTEATKAFKTKCFSTAQLKSLGALFISDEWRYRFYDAAMPFVTDFVNFKKLEETISDDYYKKRFLALLPG